MPEWFLREMEAKWRTLKEMNDVFEFIRMNTIVIIVL